MVNVSAEGQLALKARSIVEAGGMGIRWWWMSGALILSGLAGCGARGGPGASEEPGAAPVAFVTVRTEPARVGTVAEVVEGLGRCEALPDHLATLTPAVEGHVEDLLVAQGTPVQKGQPILELDRSVARADLAEKTASRDGLKASLGAAEIAPPARRASGQ